MLNGGQRSKDWLHIAKHILIASTLAFLALLAVPEIATRLGNDDPRAASLPEYLRPFRPLPIRIINGLGTLLGRFGLLDFAMPLDADYLLANACRSLGEDGGSCVLYNDGEGGRQRPIGGDAWRGRLDLLSNALRNEAKLTLLGRVVAQGQLKEVLITRGRLLRAFQKEEEQMEGSPLEPIRDPIFVVGLPRTGTTLLQRLLAVDPFNRSPMLYEYMNPVPRPMHPPLAGAGAAEMETYAMATRDKVAAYQRDFLDQYKRLAPGLDAMHPLNATNPEECIVSLNYVLDSQQMDVTYPAHSYMRHLLSMEDNHEDSLRFHRRVLQYLQQDDPHGPRRWVLKTPYFLVMLDGIRSVYPNAKIIHMHRDPLQSVLSTSSVVTKTLGVVTDDIDPRRIGAHQALVHEEILRRAIKVRRKWHKKDKDRDEGGEEDGLGRDQTSSSFRVADAHLRDLQQDPVGTIDRIYRELFGEGLSTEAVRLMREWLRDNPRNKHGLHRPKMEDFGLDSGRMVESAVFSTYRSMFQVQGAATIP